MKRLLSNLFGASLIALMACGGGGGSPDPEPLVNQAPIAAVPTNFLAVVGEVATLDGSQSADSDGSISTYEWTQISGSPTVTLNNADTSTATFVAPDVSSSTSLTFRLTVTDNEGATGTDTVIVAVDVDQPPVVVVPEDFEAVELTSVLLDGSSTTDDVSISSYAWVQLSGESVALENANSAVASFTAPEVAVNETLSMSFELTVTDSNAQESVDTVNVTIIDTPDESTLSGKITYDHVQHNSSTNTLNYAGALQDEVRGATVELLNAAGTTILDTTTSDENGDYSFVVEQANSYIVRVKAELKKTGNTPTWDFTVVDNTSGEALYSMQSSVAAISSVSTTLNINAPSGWDGSGLNEARVAAPFAILDSVYEAKEKVVTADSSINMVALKLNWSVNNVAVSGDKAQGQIGTSHFDGSEVFILGDAGSDTDEYDGHVIVHEWGHYFEGRHSRSDSIGGSHSGNDKLDIRVALGEGFGNALSGIVTDDPFYRDSFSGSGFSINIESNPSGTNKGWFSESTVQSLIYDFYDDNNDGADSLSLGFTPIYEVLVGGEKNTPALTSIFSFSTQLKLVTPSNAAAINTLLASQDISGTDDFGTGETNNGGDSRNLPVYSGLTDNGSIQLCSYGTNGSSNKLGNRKFIKIEISTTGSYTITANGTTTGDDPDLYVYQNGTLAFKSDVVGNESTTQQIAAGTYVMDVSDYNNIDRDGTVRDTCIDITLSAN
ncbi:MAG: hypothetical protein KUG78_06450 [Kangiellaceae bacterium]|nr:hypothetical protein [Kangiellaceae bacterium]